MSNGAALSFIVVSFFLSESAQFWSSPFAIYLHNLHDSINKLAKNLKGTLLNLLTSSYLYSRLVRFTHFGALFFTSVLRRSEGRSALINGYAPKLILYSS